ncbi:hypothetical protein [Azospirillum picis]|uniref:Uncharacterized protein n=1 Tax=Azospirillum picis TaxID=488438 RepID=A0ABU0MNU8_9PROT|nr:hypothetical protein [Azospirillum picis]MBP2301317.1 hypothetical protein [Azospirillum picis]MDQ0535148.1 hypothetical protein [Azospirillum picis]
MGFLGQGLQRTRRDAPGTLQFAGMDYITAAGAFNWLVPAYIDVIDIIAVGAGVSAINGGAVYGASSPVSQRVGKSVTPGQSITGTIGTTVSVDGMSLNDAATNIYVVQPAGVGGDVNFPGFQESNGPADIYSLTGNLIGPSIDGSARINRSYSPTAQYSGTFPGGGASRGIGSTPNYGGSAAVFFVMFRRVR